MIFLRILSEVFLEIFLVLGSRAGPRSDPGELQSVVCILQSRTALVCLAWLVMCVAAARITPQIGTPAQRLQGMCSLVKAARLL